jgi:hypothetical protein
MDPVPGKGPPVAGTAHQVKENIGGRGRGRGMEKDPVPGKGPRSTEQALSIRLKITLRKGRDGKDPVLMYTCTVAGTARQVKKNRGGGGGT